MGLLSAAGDLKIGQLPCSGGDVMQGSHLFKETIQEVSWDTLQSSPDAWHNLN